MSNKRDLEFLIKDVGAGVTPDAEVDILDIESFVKDFDQQIALPTALDPDAFVQQPVQEIVQPVVQKDAGTEAPATEVIPTLKNEENGASNVDAQKSLVVVETGGPTSWGELEERREAQEKAAAVRQTTWDAEMLVHNVLRSFDTPDSKAKKIKNIADGLSDRAVSEMKKDFDFDLLEIEATIGQDHVGFIQTIKDLAEITKGKLSVSDLPDEDFAYVVTRDGTKERKYLIHNQAHVRNSLVRAAKMIKKGGQDEEDARKALPAIKEEAIKYGIGLSESGSQKSLMLIKDAEAGKWRWFGTPTNNFIDWDGDIISKDAHVEFVEWLDKNSDLAPVFVSWHTPGTRREHQADFWMEKDGFLLMSGLLEDHEAAGLMKAMAKTTLGMSHGSLAVQRDPSDKRVITKYRMYEVSDLPLTKAANPFTSLETFLSKEVGMDKTKYLATILGSEEKATSFLARTDQTSKQLQEAGVENKEIQPDGQETVQEASEDVTQVAQKDASDEDLLKRLMDELDVDGLNAVIKDLMEQAEKVPVLEALVKDLVRDEGDKLAEMISPPTSGLAWSQRPSQSKENVIKEGDDEDVALKDSTPGIPADAWLSQATNTAPVVAQE